MSNEVKGNSEEQAKAAELMQELPDWVSQISIDDEIQGFITVDENENITYINKELCQKLGYERLELLGESFLKLTSKNEFERMKAFTQKRKDGRASTYNIILSTKEKEKLIFLVSAAPLFVDNQYLGSLGIFSDVTSQKVKELNLETSIQYHELMVEFLPLGLLILDSDGKIINMNPAFTKITNMQQVDLLNKSVFEIPFLAELKYRYALDNLLLYQLDYDFETDRIRHKRREYYLRMRGYHLPTRFQRSYYLLVFGDITSRKQQEMEVKEKMDDLIILENHLQETISRKEKELQEKEWQLLEQARQETNRAILAKIAHFWRQPLNNATILIQSLQDDYDFGELNEHKFNQKVNTAVDELISLSNTLETFGYLSNDDVQKSDFRLAQVIDKSLNILRPNCVSSNIKLLTEFDDRIATSGYPRRFGQVIVNIVENAMTAIDKNEVIDPYISITLKFGSGSARIIISDNAGGIEADILTRIFDPYFTTDENSQGLGLYIAKKVITEMYAGIINYEFNGEGSDFVIKMPAKISSE